MKPSRRDTEAALFLRWHFSQGGGDWTINFGRWTRERGLGRKNAWWVSHTVISALLSDREDVEAWIREVAPNADDVLAAMQRPAPDPNDPPF